MRLMIVVAALIAGMCATQACESIDPRLGCMDSRMKIEDDYTRFIDREELGIIPAEVDKVMVPPTPSEAESIKQWIPYSCCRSNNCCRKVRADSLTIVEKNMYRVEDTGQLKVRQKWSEDGNVWRCACDRDRKTGGWTVWPGAHTRCIFPIPYGS